MPKIFILAGDPSGDIHSARLMKALLEINPDIEFIGIGGQFMTAAGLESILPIAEVSVVGFWEVAKKYFFFKNLQNKCKDIIINQQIDLFLPVDYPGFNIPLADFAKKNNVPVAYYIAPQLWAWGKNRAKKLADSVDKLLVAFPFEEDFFRKYGIDTQFVGHPLLDSNDFDERILTFSERDNLIAIMPGSREQEIIRHIPLMQEVVGRILEQKPDYKIGIGVSPSIPREFYENFLKNKIECELFENSRLLMNKAKAGIIKTGTSNLEAVMCGMPFNMFYRTSGLTYYLGSKLVNLEFISLANILAGKEIVKEFIQSTATPKAIADDILNLVSDELRFKNIQNEFVSVCSKLGTKGASARSAKIILDLIEQRKNHD
ncbi:MAG: lipid-A-disaccharide synthase [Bacteroidota bacterium]